MQKIFKSFKEWNEFRSKKNVKDLISINNIKKYNKKCFGKILIRQVYFFIDEKPISRSLLIESI